jgi:serine/threonine protein phosphatase PrpC
LLINSSGITDVGLKREKNEDFFSADDSIGLYVVADGMGGHLAGEVASRVAVEMIINSFRQWKESGAQADVLYDYPEESLSLDGNYVLSSIRLANRVVYEMAAEHEQYNGMGTTVAVVAVAKDLVVAANVGDSRVYLVRNGQIERLSRDHTVVAEQVEMGIMTASEAESSPLKHILTRNLGSSQTVNVEIFEIDPVDNDRYLLCTDGVTDLIPDETILEVILGGVTPELLCRNLVGEALKRGGHDNITAVFVALRESPERQGGAVKKTGSMVADLVTQAKESVRKLRK